MLKELINYFFPNFCGLCGKKINSRYTCEKCLNIIKYSKGMIYFPKSNKEYYDVIICAFEYKDLLKNKMLQLKFRDKRYIARSFGEILAVEAFKHSLNADAIIPVPISISRYFERGYNQSEFIGKYMSEICNIKLEKNALIKKKENKRQSKLSEKERLKNVEGVFIANLDAISNYTNVILVDDIYTTGATINECAKVLKKAGIKKVYAMTVLYSAK